MKSKRQKQVEALERRRADAAFWRKGVGIASSKVLAGRVASLYRAEKDVQNLERKLGITEGSVAAGPRHLKE